MHLVTANSSFPSITAQILFQIGARHTPGENLLRAWLHLENCSGEGLALCPRWCPPQILLPSPPACSTPGVTPGQGSSTEAVLTHCCLNDEPGEATSLYQQLQEHCCLFLQHSLHKQQDFYCPISSSSYYLKNDSLGEEKAAWVIIYVKIIAGICSGWNI